MAEQPNSEQYKQKFRRGGDEAVDREVEAAMAGLSLESLYEQSAPQETAVERRTKGPRKGKVISVSGDQVFLDLGGKNQGIAPLEQFEQPPAVGAEVEVNVDRFDSREGLLICSRLGAPVAGACWETLEIGQVLEGVVTGMNKGGLELNIRNMRAFLPAGQVDIYFQKDISVLLGQKVTVEVTQFDRERKNLIVSRRNVLEREKEQARQKLMEELAVEQTRRGTVRSVMDFGAFVDLGGVDGLLHVSEISHKRLKTAAEVLKVGDVVDVKIIKIDKETGKISLSMKAAMPDPWMDADRKYPVGSTLTARVLRLESFGAFVEVQEGLEALLPVSEMSWQRIGHPRDVLREGDVIKLAVVAVDPAARRMTLSLKQAGPDPWKDASQKYPVNTVTTGKVTRTAEFGAFVELEPGLEGLVHISELAPQRVSKVTDVVKPGQDVKVRVLEVDDQKRRIGLSIRRADEPVEAPAAMTPPRKKKRPELRGGLDFGRWND